MTTRPLFKKPYFWFVVHDARRYQRPSHRQQSNLQTTTYASPTVPPNSILPVWTSIAPPGGGPAVAPLARPRR